MNTILEKVSLSTVGILTALSILVSAGLLGVATHTAQAATVSGRVTVAVIVKGGTANPSNFTIQIRETGSSNTGTLSGSGNNVIFRLKPGNYTVSQVGGPQGYSAVWSGACTAQGNVVVVANGTSACTVTNTFGPVGSIKITQVIQGGTATPADFTLHLKKSGSEDTGSPSGSGSVVTFGQLTPGAYTVIQSTPPTGYNAVWSGACSAQGNVTVVGNATAACVVTNTYTAPNGGGTGPRTDRPASTRPTR